MLLILFVYFLLGMITGTLSGLLGIGGSIIVVPTLAFIFRYEHIPAHLVMHLAIGTSLAVMVFTTMRSLMAHLKYNGRRPFWAIAKRLMPTVLVGVVLGSIAADFLHSNVLRGLFGVIVLIAACRILFYKEDLSVKRRLPTTFRFRIAGLVMGSLSGLIGIGGGATVIPYLLFYRVHMRIALRVSIFVAFLVALLGSCMYAITGLNEHVPPMCIGYIYWPAWVGIAFGSMTFAPIGAKLSYYVPSRILKRIFACLIFVVGLHMLFF